MCLGQDERVWGLGGCHRARQMLGRAPAAGRADLICRKRSSEREGQTEQEGSHQL